MTNTTTSSTTALDAERSDLIAELATARKILVGTAAGLTDEQLRERPTVSELCVGGILKHVASVEAGWVRFFEEGPQTMSFDLPDGVTWADIMSGTATTFPQWMVDRENDLKLVPEDTLESILERYAEIAAHTDRLVAELPDLSDTFPLPEAPWNEPGASKSIRGVILHIIAETTQHAGHADIIRETLDGQTTT